MNASTQTTRLCPACRQSELVEGTRDKHFRPRGEVIRVELRVSRCPACGAELINAEQRRENLERLRARKAAYGDLLLGEEIVALRKRYGLTQQMAAAIFGKGKIAFSRYENESSYPDATTTKLLNLAIKRPQVLKELADEAGVDVPLWAARCEDERKVKVRVFQATKELRPEELASWHARSASTLAWPTEPMASMATGSRSISRSANDELYQGAMTA